MLFLKFDLKMLFWVTEQIIENTQVASIGK